MEGIQRVLFLPTMVRGWTSGRSLNVLNFAKYPSPTLPDTISAPYARNYPKTGNFVDVFIRYNYHINEI